MTNHDLTKGVRVLPHEPTTVIEATDRTEDGDILHTEHYVRVPDDTRGADGGLVWRNLTDGELYSAEVIQATDTWRVISRDTAATTEWITTSGTPIEVDGKLHYAIPAWMLAEQEVVTNGPRNS